jgi:hypothetical protein
MFWWSFACSGVFFMLLLYALASVVDTLVDTYTEISDHTFGAWIILKESTCLEKGSNQRRCRICQSQENCLNIPSVTRRQAVEKMCRLPDRRNRSHSETAD